MYAPYKAGRSERSDLFHRLKKWALKKYMFPKGFEADDLASHYAREGALVVSFDKDVYKSSEGIFYNPHHKHMCIIKTTKEEARRFTLLQVLTGDSTDNIPALPKFKGDDMVDGIPTTDGTRKPFKVTEKLATELLDKHGWDWNGVIKSFEEKGFSEVEAIRNRRLTDMHQLRVTKKGKFKLKLFDPKKDEK